MAEPLPEVSTLLLDTLDELTDDDFKRFKWHLNNSTRIRGHQLDKSSRSDTASLMTQELKQEAITVAIRILGDINRKDLVESLSHNNPGDSQR